MKAIKIRNTTNEIVRYISLGISIIGVIYLFIELFQTVQKGVALIIILSVFSIIFIYGMYQLISRQLLTRKKIIKELINIDECFEHILETLKYGLEEIKKPGVTVLLRRSLSVEFSKLNVFGPYKRVFGMVGQKYDRERLLPQYENSLQQYIDDYAMDDQTIYGIIADTKYKESTLEFINRVYFSNINNRPQVSNLGISPFVGNINFLLLGKNEVKEDQKEFQWLAGIMMFCNDNGIVERGIYTNNTPILKVWNDCWEQQTRDITEWDIERPVEKIEDIQRKIRSFRRDITVIKGFKNILSKIVDELTEAEVYFEQPDIQIKLYRALTTDISEDIYFEFKDECKELIDNYKRKIGEFVKQALLWDETIYGLPANKDYIKEMIKFFNHTYFPEGIFHAKSTSIGLYPYLKNFNLLLIGVSKGEEPPHEFLSGFLFLPKWTDDDKIQDAIYSTDPEFTHLFFKYWERLKKNMEKYCIEKSIDHKNGFVLKDYKYSDKERTRKANEFIKKYEEFCT